MSTKLTLEEISAIEDMSLKFRFVTIEEPLDSICGMSIINGSILIMILHLLLATGKVLPFVFLNFPDPAWPGIVFLVFQSLEFIGIALMIIARIKQSHSIAKAGLLFNYLYSWLVFTVVIAFTIALFILIFNFGNLMLLFIAVVLSFGFLQIYLVWVYFSLTKYFGMELIRKQSVQNASSSAYSDININAPLIPPRDNLYDQAPLPNQTKV